MTMRSLLMIQDSGPPNSQAASKLRAAGYAPLLAHTEEQACADILHADAVILHVAYTALARWIQRLRTWKTTPVIWWFRADSASAVPDLDQETPRVDGMLTDAMEIRELQYALRLCARNHEALQALLLERSQLLARVEDRKWIDKAKGILCEIKRISEAEAYELLRSQAMDERKRMADVARSIVNVYELIRDQKQRGGHRK